MDREVKQILQQFGGMDKEVKHILQQFGGMDKVVQHVVHQFGGMDKETRHMVDQFGGMDKETRQMVHLVLIMWCGIWCSRSGVCVTLQHWNYSCRNRRLTTSSIVEINIVYSYSASLQSNKNDMCCESEETTPITFSVWSK
ncbi:hypothetical protein A2U01_0035166 [Trifolium medium]|uniref:Uncharacterized protein n=1 Tax=Trifolium medium TaxID=97028 RepID=A0A392PRB5_9FABA|nr:hypothetical protein [Trifolium medium]